MRDALRDRAMKEEASRMEFVGALGQCVLDANKAGKPKRKYLWKTASARMVKGRFWNGGNRK